MATAVPARTSLEDGPPEVKRAADALRDNRADVAESILRRFLEANPDNIEAIKLMADTVLRFERAAEAEQLLTRALAIDPDFAIARHSYATLLLTQRRPEEAFAQIGELLARDPENANHHNLKAIAHAWVGDFEGAAREYADLTARWPRMPGAWIAYGQTLRTLGRNEECVATFRETIRRFPRFGEAYWELASIKSFHFTDDEVETMRTQMETVNLTVDSRIFLQFALARALRDRGDFAQSIEKYREANAQYRATMNYNAELTTTYVLNTKTVFTPSFLAERAGWGCPSPDPIFIVGAPRSGATLVEQILASHSAIEGTMELPVVRLLVSRISTRAVLRNKDRPMTAAMAADVYVPYPEVVRNIDADGYKAMGEDYLKRAQIHRTQNRPFFIDRSPDNFAHIGLIHLMLPNAKIIDIRRDPMASCVSSFTHHFSIGKDFAYSLSDLGRFYADYLALMAHFDKVLPGKVHHVQYEELVDNPDGEIRRLFDYLGLPFEDQCLRFHDTERPVRSPSADTVRKPVFSDSLAAWKDFEPWLGPLRHALGTDMSSNRDA